ncbi:MAG: tyrosine-type recombinase/integrase [Chitinophagaceae bacterium]
MPLTELECRTAKVLNKTKKLFAENGLYLEVNKSGQKYWRYKYRYLGKEKRLALGVYPEISLKKARELRDDARTKLRNNIDPAEEKKSIKRQLILNSENTFKSITLEWHEKRKHLWTEKHARKLKRRFEKTVFPVIGSLPMNKINAPELLSFLRKLESAGKLDLTHRINQTIGQVFRYAIATGRAERDVTSDLRGALAPVRKKGHAHLKENELPEFLQLLEKYEGDVQTKIGLKLLLLTFTRTIELRGAKWLEVDFVKAEWRIPAERMKMRVLHIVPLSTHALALFKELRVITGAYEHVFPNRNNPKTFISENTFLYALYRMGYHSRTTAHGFRSTASTILNENGFRSDAIERQLAHCERNRVRASYNFAQYLPERKEMMQWWSNYIQGLTNEW